MIEVIYEITEKIYSIIKQNYSKTNYTSALHKCVNNVDGLEYTFYEEHNPYVIR